MFFVVAYELELMNVLLEYDWHFFMVYRLEN